VFGGWWGLVFFVCECESRGGFYLCYLFLWWFWGVLTVCFVLCFGSVNLEVGVGIVFLFVC